MFAGVHSMQLGAANMSLPDGRQVEVTPSGQIVQGTAGKWIPATTTAGLVPQSNTFTKWLPYFVAILAGYAVLKYTKVIK